MPSLPKTQYTKSGDLHIAYQVTGKGPFDLVFVPGFVSHLEYQWEYPGSARLFERLGSFSRLICFDKRGTGLSDRVGNIPTLEQRMDDVRAVMDAIGSERAALFGISEGGPMSLLFAATYPERTSALVLYGSYARRTWAADHPVGRTAEEMGGVIEAMERDWGGPVAVDLWAPSLAADERFCHWWANYLRLAASPGAAITVMRMNMEIDVRHVLPSVHVPTLIIHRTGDRVSHVEQGRYLMPSDVAGLPRQEVAGAMGAAVVESSRSGAGAEAVTIASESPSREGHHSARLRRLPRRDSGGAAGSSRRRRADRGTPGSRPFPPTMECIGSFQRSWSLAGRLWLHWK
jgi:pimeloyl-ACP methyl ester carboxylesterase